MMRSAPCLRRLARFFGNRAGMAAVEFALVAPMMIVLLFGSVEIVNALQTQRRVENVASSLADVVARDTEVSNAELSGLWSALTPLMYPDQTGGLSVRITSITINSATDARVVWAERQGTYFTSLPVNDRVTGLATAMMVPGTSIVRVETRYNYVPVLGFWMLNTDRVASRNRNTLTVGHTSYSRSRLVDPIPRVS